MWKFPTPTKIPLFNFSIRRIDFAKRNPNPNSKLKNAGCKNLMLQMWKFLKKKKKSSFGKLCVVIQCCHTLLLNTPQTTPWEVINVQYKIFHIFNNMLNQCKSNIILFKEWTRLSCRRTCIIHKSSSTVKWHAMQK